MSKISKPLLILFAVGLICRNFGPLSFDLTRVLLLSVLTIYTVVTIPVRRGSIAYSFLCMAAGLVLIQFDAPLVLLSLLVLLLFIMLLCAQRCGLSRVEHTTALFTTAAFTLLYFLYSYFPEGWYAVEFCSWLFSSLCSMLYVRTLNVGPTAFGFFIALSFIIYHCVLFALDEKRSLLRFILIFAYLVCITALFTGMNIYVVSLIRKKTLAVAQNTLHTQAILFLLLSLSIFLQHKRTFRAADILPDRRSLKYALPCIILFTITLVVYCYVPVAEEPMGYRTAAFYKQSSGDWNTPRFGTYGQRSGGMFGLMPKYLPAMGYKSRMIDTLIPRNIADADVIVMVNLNKKLTMAELTTVWNFVRHGGGLLLLGDHTNLSGLMINFNHVLRGVPIKFKFDSAMPSRYVWDFLVNVRPHPLTNGFDYEIGRSWWVGASLACSYPAVPLVIGKYCYSDWGYKHNKKKAYLGNRRFDYYEQLNDVVLAAVAPLARGKIMVCGDTSAFHNTTFMTTHPFIVNAFNILSDRNGKKPLIPEPALKLLLFLSILGLIILFFTYRATCIIPVTAIAALCLVVSFAAHADRQRQRTDIPYGRVRVAYIDYSHKGRFDLMSWEDDSIGGLKNNLMRNGYYPFLLKRFDPARLMKAHVLILIAPTKPFSADEVEAVKKFVSRGGKLFVTAGWEERDAVLPLLDAFGLGIDSVPLGSCTARYKKTTVRFHEAWPVTFNKDDPVRIISRPLGYPALITRQYGRGSVVLAGDSNFLLNENLEGAKKHYVPNIFLLRDLLMTTKK